MEQTTFTAFLAEYRATYGPISDRAMRQKLGVSKSTFIRLKQRGGSQVLAYACAALIHNLREYDHGK